MINLTGNVKRYRITSECRFALAQIPLTPLAPARNKFVNFALVKSNLFKLFRRSRLEIVGFDSLERRHWRETDVCRILKRAHGLRWRHAVSRFWREKSLPSNGGCKFNSVNGRGDNEQFRQGSSIIREGWCVYILYIGVCHPLTHDAGRPSVHECTVYTTIIIRAQNLRLNFNLVTRRSRVRWI